MRLIALLVMAFGIALAGGSIYYAQKFLDERIGAIEAQPATHRILVAKQRLTQGDILAAQHLKWVEWPTGSIPDGAFSSIEALFGRDHKDRRYVKRTIESGELILDSKISEPNKAGSLKDELPPGYRAVSIAVDAVAIVSGFVSVGDHVDILLTHSPEGQLVSSVILQGIEILAIDQNFDSDQYDPKVGRTVTVLVTTRQAQLLTLARERGRLSLNLIGYDESTPGQRPPPVTDQELNDVFKQEIEKKNEIRVCKAGVCAPVEVE